MRVEKLFERLKREFLKVNLLQAALDSMIFFLSANLVLFLFSLRFASAGRNLDYLVPLTFIVFCVDLFHRSRKYNIEIYEQKNPELKERLRTARDNIDANNIVSQALFDEVLDRSRSVTSDSIIPSKKIIQKMLAIGIISFLTVLSGLTNFQVLEQGGQLIPEQNDILKQVGEEKKKGVKVKNNTDIYGDAEDISVSDSLIDYNVSGSGSSSQRNPSGNDARGAENPVMSSSFSGMQENLELAKRYNLEIRDIEVES
ncbi:MAG: hypothetical protein ABEJ56_04710 [Candidatus Nanohaloarchaea archaeon]